MSPAKWIENTNAIGLVSSSGKYGGTFAHRDIAFEFASWVSEETVDNSPTLRNFIRYIDSLGLEIKIEKKSPKTEYSKV